MFARTTVLSLVLAAGLAAPAAATTIAPLKPCYVVATEDQRELIDVQVAGFTPLRSIEFYVDDILQYGVAARADGSQTGTVRAPFQEEGTRPFELRATEVGNPANTAIARSMVTRLAVEQRPRRASTGDRVRFKGRGFTDLASPVYAHYVFAGKVRRTVRIGLPKGPCGTFSVRRKQFPFKKSPRVGVWTIQFDQNQRYDPKAEVLVPMEIKVRRTPKQESARGR